MPSKEIDPGLVSVGQRLTTARLLRAYSRGIFPWYNADDPPAWYCPDPRAIFELDGLHVSRRLRRTLASGKFSWTTNRDFAAVMAGCGDRLEESWIHGDMLAAYTELHRLGHAHSLEVWQDGALAGGIYGVAVGGLFAGESMFHRRTDASKAALAFLVAHLRTRGYRLFDIQFTTPHTLSMGAVTIPRKVYLARLADAVALQVTFGTGSGP